MSFLAWAAVAVFTVAYILIATEKIHRVAAALGGDSSTWRSGLPSERAASRFG
jgi:Na+/H+ antiporter NhaD/arsenite permease-like protein